MLGSHKKENFCMTVISSSILSTNFILAKFVQIIYFWPKYMCKIFLLNHWRFRFSWRFILKAFKINRSYNMWPTSLNSLTVPLWSNSCFRQSRTFEPWRSIKTIMIIVVLRVLLKLAKPCSNLLYQAKTIIVSQAIKLCGSLSGHVNFLAGSWWFPFRGV